MFYVILAISNIIFIVLFFGKTYYFITDFVDVKFVGCNLKVRIFYVFLIVKLQTSVHIEFVRVCMLYFIFIPNIIYLKKVSQQTEI
jgi:hypothetical protein